MVAQYPALNAEKRDLVGRKVKKLRRDGFLPANIYGKKVKSQAITLSLKDFRELFAKVGETNIVEVIIKGDPKPRPCLITNIHLNPVTGAPLHADFHQVDLTQKVTADIPVEIVGESPAVKEKSAVLITLIDEIEVEALPTDLPDKFEVDVSGLKEFDASILVKDLKVDRTKVTIKLDDTDAIVMVQEHKEEVIEAPPTPPAEGEVPAEGEAAPAAEGEEPKEGEAGKPAEAKAEEKPDAEKGAAPQPKVKKE